MDELFKRGFIKEAMAEGCSLGEAIDLLKFAMFGQPITPLVNTQKPMTSFTSPKSPTSPTSMPTPAAPSLAQSIQPPVSSVTSAAPSWSSTNNNYTSNIKI